MQFVIKLSNLPRFMWIEYLVLALNSFNLSQPFQIPHTRVTFYAKFILKPCKIFRITIF